MSEIKKILCVECGKKNVNVKNIGFVLSSWKFHGLLSNSMKIVSEEGKTYDNKLHTFKENDIKQLFTTLDIFVDEYNSIPEVNDTYNFTTQYNDTEEDIICYDDVYENVDEFSLTSSRVKSDNFNQFKNSIAKHNI